MENMYLMSLGEFIAKRRKLLRMTQEDLSKELNVSKSAVAKWETDGGIPDRDNLQKLSEVFNVTLENLYRLIKNKELPEDTEFIDITEDIIALLESRGYTVIRPRRK